MEKETLAPRFENLIEIKREGKWFGFTPKKNAGARISYVFINPRRFSLVFDNCWRIENPESGCMVIVEIDHLEPVTYPVVAHRYISGYAAFVFDRKVFHWKSWQSWKRPHDVRVYAGSITDGLEIAIIGLNDKELVRVNSRGLRHELITFEHMLDYCVGQRSLADILALVEMEERRRSQNERQMTYKELLALARSFKGAVRSKTAAKIEELLMKLAGEDLPF